MGILNLDILNSISKQNYKGLEEIDIGKVVFTVLSNKRLNDSNQNKRIIKIVFYNIRHIMGHIRRIFISGIKAEIFGEGNNGRIAFVYSNNYKGRNDHYKRFRYITDLLSDKIVIEPGRKKFTISNLGILKYLCDWNNNLKQVIIDADCRNTCLSEIINAYIESSIILNYFENAPEIVHVTVFSDMHPIDNMLVQRCKQRGISTSTMQHGLMYDVSRINTCSDYFLGWGQQIVDCFTKQNSTNTNKILKLGFIKLIKEELSEKIIINHTRRILVICSVPEEDNTLLKIASDFAKNNRYKIIVKLHPNQTADSIRENNVIEKVVSNEISAGELTKYADFAILGNTTVFIEYLLELFPVFHLSSGVNSPYDEVTWGKFSTVEELENAVSLFLEDTFTTEKTMKQVRDYFTETKNVANNYIHFFNSFYYSSEETVSESGLIMHAAKDE